MGGPKLEEPTLDAFRAPSGPQRPSAPHLGAFRGHFGNIWNRFLANFKRNFDQIFQWKPKFYESISILRLDPYPSPAFVPTYFVLGVVWSIFLHFSVDQKLMNKNAINFGLASSFTFQLVESISSGMMSDSLSVWACFLIIGSFQDAFITFFCFETIFALLRSSFYCSLELFGLEDSMSSCLGTSCTSERHHVFCCITLLDTTSP